MTVDRRQVLAGTTAAVAVTICQPLADTDSQTITELVEQHRRLNVEFERLAALPDMAGVTDKALAAAYDRMTALQKRICFATPRTVDEAVMQVRLVRDFLLDDAGESMWDDSRDFVAMDSALSVLEGARS